MISNNTMKQLFSSPVREIKAKIAYSNKAITSETNLISFTIEKSGDNTKFFGYGVPQKLNVKALDKDREISISTGTELAVSYKNNATGSYVTLDAKFYVTEVNRNEKDNSVSITAYDKLHNATDYTINDITISTELTYSEIATVIATKLGISAIVINSIAEFTTKPSQINFNPNTTLRQLLDCIAEATQTIYYINYQNKLEFVRFSKTGGEAYSVEQDSYFELEVGDNRRLKGICATNELGDAVSAELAVTGTTQFIRSNGFWDNSDNIQTYVDNALTIVGGLTLAQYNLSWRALPLLEVGDKIKLKRKDGTYASCIYVNSTITYSGALSEKVKWEFKDSDNETASNPTTLGDVLNMTTARVDKATQEISLMVSNVKENTESISALNQNTSSISLSVSEISKTIDENNEAISQQLQEITNSVEAKITKDDVTIEINKAMSDINSVTTTTGFKFDEDGLNISKTGSEMTTQITEDGMTVSNSGNTTLTANNQGVEALNLHATTFLIVGNYSRFEDYGEGRTGCFPLI